MACYLIQLLVLPCRPVVKKFPALTQQHAAGDLDLQFSYRREFRDRNIQFIKTDLPGVAGSGPENDRFYPRPVYRRETHRARLGGGIDRAAGEIIFPQFPGGRPYGVHLGVAGSVVLQHGIPGNRDHPAVPNDTGAERTAGH